MIKTRIFYVNTINGVMPYISCCSSILLVFIGLRPVYRWGHNLTVYASYYSNFIIVHIWFKLFKTYFSSIFSITDNLLP